MALKLWSRICSIWFTWSLLKPLSQYHMFANESSPSSNAKPNHTCTNKDGSSVNVTTSSQVDASTKGTYTVTYTATNENGSATATRTVNVNIGQDNWLVTWAADSDCGNAFPLTPDPVFSAGAGANGLVIDNMFNLIGGTANATINGNNINIPTQTIDVTLGQVTFSGVGSINNQANTITITYTYDNTIPLIGGSGTCVATYTKQ